MNDTKRITYDWDGGGRGPAPGDVFVTKTGRQWLVVDSYHVASRVHDSRWRVDAVRAGDEAEIPHYPIAGTDGAAERVDGPMVFPLAWTPRAPKKARA